MTKSSSSNRLVILDLILIIFAAWMLIPELITGGIVNLPLGPGVHLSSSLSHRNVLILFILLIIRIHARQNSKDTLVHWAAKLPSYAHPLIIGGICFAVFMNVSQTRHWPSGDTIPSKLIPITVLEEQDLDLNEFYEGVPQSRRYAFHRHGDRWVTPYPPATGLTVVPIYGLIRLFAPGFYNRWHSFYEKSEGDDLPGNPVNWMERFSAALLTAISCIIFFLIAKPHGLSTAYWSSLLFAFGTPIVSTCSIALWQHTTSALFLLLTFWLLIAHHDKPWLIFLAGVCGGWAFACRPTNLIPFGCFFLPLLANKNWKGTVLLASGFAIPAMLTMGYNLSEFGSFLGGYTGQKSSATLPGVHAAMGLLLSPSRGLLVYCPFLIPVIIYAVKGCRRNNFSICCAALAGAAGLWIVFSSWEHWHGGVSFGPRYMAEAAVLLMCCMPLHFKTLTATKLRKAIFLFTALFACFVHLSGARHGDQHWTSRVYSPDDASVFWSISNSQLSWTLQREPPK